MVALNPNFEPRPDNYPANDMIPTSADLAQVGTISYLDSHGNELLGKVTGNYTGTTTRFFSGRRINGVWTQRDACDRRGRELLESV